MIFHTKITVVKKSVDFVVAIFIVWSHLISIGGPSIIFVKDIDGYQKISPGLKRFETIMHS